MKQRLGLATAAVIGVSLLFVLFREALVAGVYSVANGSRPGLAGEPWYFLLERTSPIASIRPRRWWVRGVLAFLPKNLII